ncbi:MAG: hypothetical protein ACRC6A_09225 [Fusobacteriaceae bacterium]
MYVVKCNAEQREAIQLLVQQNKIHSKETVVEVLIRVMKKYKEEN